MACVWYIKLEFYKLQLAGRKDSVQTWKIIQFIKLKDWKNKVQIDW